MTAAGAGAPASIDVRLRDGRTVAVRAIRGEDAAKLQAAIRQMSPASRYSRFFSGLSELPAKWLDRAVHPDGTHELQLVAVFAGGAEEEIVAGARYAATNETGACEFAVAVVDGWQGLGLARALLETLMRRARAHGFATMEGYVLATNQPMLALAKRLGFAPARSPEGPSVCLVRREIASIE